MDTLNGISPEPKKATFLQVLVLFLLGGVLGACACYLVIAQPVQQKAAKMEPQQQTTETTLVKLAQEKACAAKTFDEAVGVESLARDTLRDVNVNFPEGARQKIELCAENLRHPKAEKPKSVHKKK